MNVGRCHRGSRARRSHAMKGLIAAAALLGSASLTAAAAAPEAAVASHDNVAAVLKGDLLSLTTSNSSWATVVRELAAQTGIAFRVAPVPAGTVTVALDNVEIKRALHLLFGPDASFVFVYRAPSGATGATALDEVSITFRGAGALLARSHDQPLAIERDPRASGGATREVVPAETSVGGEASTPEPEPRLDHRDPLVRQEALNAVVERGDGSGVEEIRQVLLGDQDHEVRTRAVTVLGRIGTPEALEALRHALTDSEMTVRLTAVDAIATFETQRARALLRDALRDRDEQIRSVAAAALQALRGRGL